MNAASSLTAALLVVALSLGAARVAAAGEDDLGTLIADLLSGTGKRADRAIERLRYLGPDRAGPPLRTLLQSPDTAARIAASAALVLVRDPAAAPALAQALSDEDWEVRRNAAQALASVRARHQARALEGPLARDPNLRVRKACATALGDLGAGGPALARAAVRDASLEVRLLALDALAKGMDAKNAVQIRPLLKDGSGLVRFGTARALAWMGDGAARPFLDGAVRGDPENARRAVTVLGDVPKPWAVELLVVALAGEETVRFAAAEALARRGDRRAIPVLVAVSRGHHEGSQRASAALDALGVPPAERVPSADAP